MVTTNSKKNDDAYFEELLRKSRSARAAVLAQARREATRRGKEPFSLVRLEAFYDTTGMFGYAESREEREKTYEHKYYVMYPDVMTIEEFAEEMKKIDPYR